MNKNLSFEFLSLQEEIHLADCLEAIPKLPSHPDLWIVDPPYGQIVDDQYDQIEQISLVEQLIDLLIAMEEKSDQGTTAYVFGGIGRYRNRPFFTFLTRLEYWTNWRLHNLITWKKRRGYGTQYNYIFAREEIAFLVLGKKPKTFNVPYTTEKRSEAWMKRLSTKKYAPKSLTYLRRGNVFADVNELFRDKLCTAEKPETLYKILIETSSNEGDLVCDPMAGSGVTGIVARELGRNFILFEKDKTMFQIAKDRINGCLF
jgi:DNA modification methylase